MPERVLIDLDGSNPRFRISREGKSVYSADLSDFLLREDIPVFRSAVSGSMNFTGAGTQTATITGIAGPTFVSLRCSDRSTATYTNYYAVLVNNTTLTIRNRRPGTRTIFYSVFGNSLLSP